MMDAKSLLGVLRNASKFRSRSNIVDIVRMVRIDTSSGRFSVSASNLMCDCTLTGPECDVLMDVLVDPERLLVAIGDGESVRMELGDRLVVRRGKSVFRLEVKPGAGFPMLKPAKTWNLPAHLIKVAHGAAFATSRKNVVRPELCGVNISVKDGVATVTGADGVIASIDRVECSGSASVTIPTDALAKIKLIEPTQAGYTEDVLTVTDGENTISCKPFLTYPQFRVSPPVGTSFMQFNRTEMLSTLADISGVGGAEDIGGGATAALASFEMRDGRIVVCGGRDFEADIDIVWGGPFVDHKFRCDQLFAILNRVTSDVVRVNWDSEDGVRSVVQGGWTGLLSKMRV